MITLIKIAALYIKILLLIVLIVLSLFFADECMAYVFPRI